MKLLRLTLFSILIILLLSACQPLPVAQPAADMESAAWDDNA